MHPILKQLMSPDLPDIEQGGPPKDPASFAILVQCLIGEPGPAADTFDFIALTPDKLAGEVSEVGVLSGRGYLVMARYDFDAIKRTVEGWVAQASGADWSQTATVLCRYMMWEFEGDAAHAD